MDFCEGNQLSPSQTQHNLHLLFHIICIMLRSSTVQQTLISYHPPSHSSLYTPISFPYFIDRPCETSINVHWFNLVHGFGSVCYGVQGRRGSMLYWVVLQNQLSLGYCCTCPVSSKAYPPLDWVIPAIVPSITHKSNNEIQLFIHS